MLKSDWQLSIGTGSVQGAAMSSRVPLHSVEIVFYSMAFLLVAMGLAWYLFR